MIAARRSEPGRPGGGPRVQRASERTAASVRRSGALSYAQVGLRDRETALAVALELDGRGTVHLLGSEDEVTATARLIAEEGYRNVVVHPRSHNALDSCTWSLMALLRERDEPRFDYVRLEGPADAHAFVLVDRLLHPGGHVELVPANGLYRKCVR